MKKFALLLLVITTYSCSSQEQEKIEADAAIFPGVAPADVYYKLADAGMLLSQEYDENQCHTTLTQFYGGIQYDIDIMGPDCNSVDSVWVAVKADPELKDVLNSQQFFRIIAATSYEGSDPEGIEEWLTEHYREAESRKTIGRVEYILRAPSDYERVMIMRMAE